MCCFDPRLLFSFFLRVAHLVLDVVKNAHVSRTSASFGSYAFAPILRVLTEKGCSTRKVKKLSKSIMPRLRTSRWAGQGGHHLFQPGCAQNHSTRRHVQKGELLQELRLVHVDTRASEAQGRQSLAHSGEVRNSVQDTAVLQPQLAQAGETRNEGAILDACRREVQARQAGPGWGLGFVE